MSPPRTRFGPLVIEITLLDRFRDMAERHGRSLMGEIRYGLRVYADSVERREGAAPPPQEARTG